MKRLNVEDAVAEAKRFLARADVWLKHQGKAQKENHFSFEFSPCGADAAAVKRASLDLTKALAKLRVQP